METPEPPLQLYSAEQIGKMLHLTTDAVYKLCKRGILPHYKLEGTRGSVRIAMDDVKDLLQKRRVEVGNGRQRPADVVSDGQNKE